MTSRAIEGVLRGRMELSESAVDVSLRVMLLLFVLGSAWVLAPVGAIRHSTLEIHAAASNQIKLTSLDPVSHVVHHVQCGDRCCGFLRNRWVEHVR